MSLQTTLPPADENALSHSRALTLLIREKIHNAGGWISFEQFMNLALYAPGLGYYNSGATKLGRAGDFTTAPETSSLFGRTLARQLMQIAEQLNLPLGTVKSRIFFARKELKDLLVKDYS